ncbi:head maturation protease, ClpP-related [Polaribacter cellanae]|uniref:ATP-dependent Clp protease proteolytic subunit n=1 Tax=Polaribacter cellanae TaxID=2818493 RepID=A0A975H936_9FLAO|nr:head maturation protease, ClpP-related [Polaribacter cellanae]QTE22395.1 Clp protease ClpP [Polaribacter cellanae]
MKELTIYGQIGREITDESFLQELKKVQGDFTLKINSPGGSVFQGYAIYNALKEHKGNITVHIDGVAASMASVICLAGNKIVMAKNAMYMIHNPTMSAQGDSKEMKKSADLLDKIKSILIEAYFEKTSIKKTKLSKMLDKETWLNSDEALKNGFIDEVKNNVLTKKVNSLANNPSEIFACYVINKSENMNKEVLKLLDLKKGASDEEIVKAVKKLKKQKKKEKKGEKATKESIDAILNMAEKEKKITPNLRGHFEKMLNLDYSGTNDLINEMIGIKIPISEMLVRGSSAKTPIEKDKSKWELDDYRKYAPNELKRKPKLYQELVAKAFPDEQ